MLRILKIARLAAAIGAVAAIVFLAIAGFKPDEDIKAILERESAVDKFRKLKLDQFNRDKDKESPLVTEAKAFALRIDPPPPPKPPEPEKKVLAQKESERKKPVIKRPEPKKQMKTSKFSLVATCRYENVPEKSLALLDVVREGQKWVRQGETIGHLTVHEVKDGSIVLYQGDNFNTEIYVPEEKHREKSLLKTAETKTAQANRPSSATSRAIEPGQDMRPTASPSALSRPRRVGANPSRRSAKMDKPKLTPEEEKKRIRDNISQIRDIMKATQKETTPGNADELKAWGELLQELEKSEENLESRVEEGTKAPVEGRKSSVQPKSGTAPTKPPSGAAPKGNTPPPGPPREDAALLEALKALADK